MESLPGVDPLILHWVRRYPPIYKTLDEVYVPITINVKDQEYLDVVYITATQSVEIILTNIKVTTYSHRTVYIKSEKTYFFKVTIFSRNADPKSKTLRFQWNGTWEGFNEEVVSLVS